MISFNISNQQLEDRFTVPDYLSKHILSEISRRIPFEILGEIGDPISGSYIDKYVEQGSLYLRAQNIRRYNLDLNKVDIKYVNPQHPDIKKTMIVKENDVLLTRTGLYLGSSCVAPNDAIGSMISQHLTRLESKKIDPHYITAILNSPIGKFQIDAKSMGSTRPELTHSALKSIMIPMVSKQTCKESIQEFKKANSKRVIARKLIHNAINALEKILGFDTFLDPKLMTYNISSANVDEEFTPKYYYPPFHELEKQLVSNNNTIKLRDIPTSIIRGN